MLIENQDRDRTYNISELYYKRHSAYGIFMGYNIYGKSETGKRNYFLATYDTQDDAKQICEEVQRLKDKGTLRYAMPQPSDIDDLDIFEMLGGN